MVTDGLEPKAKTIVEAGVPAASKESKADAESSDAELESKEAPNSKWDAETKAYISGLRSESAGWRKKFKEQGSQLNQIQSKLDSLKSVFSGEEQDPAEAAKNLQNNNEQLLARNAILETGIQYGIPPENFEFWGYRISKAAEDLGDGEELGHDELSVIANEVRAIKFSSKENGGIKTSTTAAKNPAPAKSSDVTVADFKKMGILDKSRLQREQPEVYEQLKTESRA